MMHGKQLKLELGENKITKNLVGIMLKTKDQRHTAFQIYYSSDENKIGDVT